MQKKIKMLLYGDPGVGKSVFAIRAPKPYFICTDGNYEWLEEFGATDEGHVNVTSWSQMQTALNSDFEGYDTIVVDLIEDGFKWCEMEYCARNKIEHVSDVGYGKAYDATRNEFFIAICKLLASDKNVILLSHATTFSVKDRRGVEHTKYAPSSRLPDKVLDMIEGRIRYCLRCYTAATEDSDGHLTKRRFLSLVPKENEFGIIRGVDENTIPSDIELDFNVFAKAIGIDVTPSKTDSTRVTSKRKVASTAKDIVDEVSKNIKPSEPVKNSEMKNAVEQTICEKTETSDNVEQTPETQIKTEDVQTVPAQTTLSQHSPTTSGEDKLAAIKAKLAAMRAK